ncbi:MAG: hypothetical protein LBL44_00910 [Treponema sp.]|jgi:hypothetical protein|nr:hypothetical protein [Treponema sp.]
MIRVQTEDRPDAAAGFVPAESALAVPAPDTGSFDLQRLRNKIHDNDYLSEAIQRIALVLSNELLDISQGGVFHERQRKRR